MQAMWYCPCHASGSASSASRMVVSARSGSPSRWYPYAAKAASHFETTNGSPARPPTPTTVVPSSRATAPRFVAGAT